MRVNIIHNSFSHLSYNFPESSRNLRIKLGEDNAATLPEPILTQNCKFSSGCTLHDEYICKKSYFTRKLYPSVLVTILVVFYLFQCVSLEHSKAVPGLNSCKWRALSK